MASQIGCGGNGRGSPAAGVFGIDLGTTYSAVAHVDATGRPVVCANAEGAATTPSAVSFRAPGDIVVGEAARRSALVDAERVVTLIKRQMGRDVRLLFDDVEYTPESVSALILKQLAQDAAAATGRPVGGVVITVPAWFGMPERQATVLAGRIAGLDVLGLVPEPVAAALHYGLDRVPGNGAGRTVLVYDLGGGTFDTSVIRIKPDETTVLCTDGDSALGGADWDERLSAHLLARFVERARPSDDLHDDPEFQQELRDRAEAAKRALSTQERFSVPLEFAGAAADVEVDRALFEELTGDLLDRTVDIVRRTLATLAAREPGAIVDDVLLVGGSTRMPAVAARLAAELGVEPRLHDPELAVAKGAAVYALSRSVDRAITDAAHGGTTATVVARHAADVGITPGQLGHLVARRTRTVLPRAFGIKLLDTAGDTAGGRPTGPVPRFLVEHLVHANDPLPTGPQLLDAVTAHDGQTTIEIELNEQAGTVESPHVGDNTPVPGGRGVIAGLPPLPAGSPVRIVLAIDENGLLHLQATELTHGRSLRIRVGVGVLSESEVGAATQVVARLQVSGRGRP